MKNIKYPDLFHKYKQAEAATWRVEEVDLSFDKRQYDNLTDDEKHFLNHVLAFFAASDMIVNANLAQRFSNDIPILEVQLFYAQQRLIEQVHSEMYALLIETFVDNTEEKKTLFNALNSMQCVGNKAKWAIKWINDTDATFATRLVAFAVVEGIFFSGSFAAIFWLKKRGLMPGLSFSNELISRDEGLHTEFACLLYSKKELLNSCRLNDSVVESIIREAVDIEKEFMTQALDVSIIGMNSKLMCQYIEYVADRLLEMLGYTSIYNSINPFDFMENISLEGKTNFFEKRVGEYQQFGAIDHNDDNNKDDGSF